MKMFMRCAAVLLLCAPLAFAKGDPLTRQEIDQLREATQKPEKRIKLLVQFTQARMLAIQQVHSDPKIVDRPEQLHQLLEDFNYLTDEIDDNLDMYTRHGDDFRKALKVAVEAYSDWQVKLRALKETSKPEDLKKFSFVLETAVENVNAGADITRELLAEQEQAAADAKKQKKKTDPTLEESAR